MRREERTIKGEKEGERIRGTVRSERRYSAFKRKRVGTTAGRRN
jgi:hypothetical protein